MILVYLIPIAIVTGLLRGGSLRHYAKQPLKGALLPCFAFLLEAFLNRLVALSPLEAPLSKALLCCAQYALLFAFFALNWQKKGARWLFAGALLNFLVIAANGFSMPVSELSRRLPQLAQTAARIDSGELMEYVIVDIDAPLYFLGDIIYLPFLPKGLASLGDFVLGAGLFYLITELMRRPKGPSDPATESPPRSPAD